MSPFPMPDRYRNPTIACLLTVATFLLYAPTFGYGWNYDDFMVIVDNPDVRSLREFWQNSYPGRPLRELTFLLDHALFGYEPRWWHLQNIGWHALNGVLGYFVLLRLGLSRLQAGLAAAVFLMHPLQVEVVASTSHRKDSLAVAVCLGSLLAYMRASRGRPWLWRGLALGCYLLASEAKETTVLLPVLWVVYELFFLEEPARWLARRAWLRFWPGLLAVGAAGFLGWFFAFGGRDAYLEAAGHLLAKVQYFAEPSLGGYLRLLFTSWSFMALRIVWPRDLAVEYLLPVTPDWFGPWVVAGLLLAVCGVAGFWLAWRRRLALPVFAGSWMVLLWLPAANLVPFALAYPAADRYLYSVVFGAGMLLAWLSGRVVRSARVLALAGVVAVVVLAGASWRQIPTWATEESVYRQALAVSPGNSYVLNELGKIAEKQGRAEEAMQWYRQALQHHPGNAAAHFNLGQLLEGSGRLAEALKHYQVFLQDDSPAYREATSALEARLRRQYGLVFKGKP